MGELHRFLATAHQMNVIQRWNNKPNLFSETVAAHSFLVATIGWILSAEAQRRGEPVDLTEVLKRSLAHDLHEVITGDILAPTKRAAQEMRQAVHQLERLAGEKLSQMLPADVRPRFATYIVEPFPDPAGARLLETADLLAAFLKAWLEVRVGNDFHRESFDRVRRLLGGKAGEEVHSLLWELDLYRDDLDGGPSLARFLSLLFRLYHVRRWNNLPSLAPSSVAAHSYLLALIAWVLAETENARNGANLPVSDVIRRALLYEAPKAVTGDILYHSKTATPAMERGVEVVRAQAAQHLIDTLPAGLRPVFTPYLEPLPGDAEQLVADASLIAGYLEADMEVRLGNTYFQPILDRLLERVETPFATTLQILGALRQESPVNNR